MHLKKPNSATLVMQVSIEERREPELMWNQAVSFLLTRILGTACELGLSSTSLALSQRMSHLERLTEHKHINVLPFVFNYLPSLLL